MALDSGLAFNFGAMALRKAVVGTNIGGTPEIITDGENGFLIDPDDVNQLVSAILRLKAPAVPPFEGSLVSSPHSLKSTQSLIIVK